MRSLSLLLLPFSLVPPAQSATRPFAFGEVRFEANRGQTDPTVRYLARARGQQIYLTDSGIVFAPSQGRTVRLSFPGAGAAAWTPAGEAVDFISYRIGSDPSKWVDQAPVYERVVWRNMYPGIDLAVYGKDGDVEYDLVLAPGADASRVIARFSGADSIRTAAGGAIEIHSGGSVIQQKAPEIYQEITPGRRSRVTGGFARMSGNRFRLNLGAYERSQTLIVDPVLVVSTYLGGENDDEIVATADGYVAGNTRSLAFTPDRPAFRQGRDMFVRGLGQAPGLSSNTFNGTVIFGGSGDDELTSIALTSSSFGFYLAGTTTSRDLPSAGNSTYKGGPSDGFLALMAYNGAIQQTFYVGGSGEDRIHGVAATTTLSAVAGVTDSDDLPVGQVPQTHLRGGKDAFYVTLSGSVLSYGYLGGSGDDAAYAISIRNSASIWIGGETRSADFPFAEPGLSGASDGFLAEISTPGSFLSSQPVVRHTLYRIGGSGEDSVRALIATPSTVTAGIGGGFIARPFPADSIGIGFAGVTTSSDLPVKNAAQTRPGGEADGFAGMWDVAGGLRWMTYLGGSGPDEATAIAQNWAGDLYIGGWTRSTDLPVAQPLQERTAGGEDGMLAVLESNGTLRHLTYFGGSGDDRIRDVRFMYNAQVRIAGSTTSTDLPQRARWQERSLRSEGFVAEIGTDYLICPSEIILAKDGILYFSVRIGREAFRESVTYKSSDPSRVRLVYLGRSYAEVTAAAEESIAVEALADSGDVEVTVTAAGLPVKTIRVRLYPGAYMFTPASTLWTWQSPVSISAGYRAIDPATDQPVGITQALRPGVAVPAFQWGSSDSSVVQVSTTALGASQMRALRPGAVTLALTVPGFRVLQPERVITANAPRYVAAPEMRLGRDMMNSLPAYFDLGGLFIAANSYRGTLTARSSDPSRLLVSASNQQAGVESVTVSMAGRGSAIFAHALASEGTVQVLVSSSEFDGEIPINVILEPTVVRFGARRYVGTRQVFDTEFSLETGLGQELVYAISGASGSDGIYRPGAPPLTFTAANSNPRVVELDRITLTTAVTSAYRFIALARVEGTADLTFSISSDHIRPVDPFVRINVQPKAPPALRLQTQPIRVGNQLQTQFYIRYDGAAAVAVESSDPSLVVVSNAAKTPGSRQIELKSPVDSAFFVQGLKSEGEATLRVRAGTEEEEIKVILVPSAIGFVPPETGSAITDFPRSYRVMGWAVEPGSGVGFQVQIPLPGPGIPVRLRSEGDPVKIYRDSFTLTADAAEGALNFAPLSEGQEATLIAEADAPYRPSTYYGRVKIRGPVPSTEPTVTGTVILTRDELRSIGLPYTSQQTEFSITSSDPERLLLSAAAKDKGAASLRLPGGTSTIYLHALSGQGTARVRIESAATGRREVLVAFQPLQMILSSSTTVAQGQSVDYYVQLNTSSGMRPGAGTYRFDVRVADSSIATVKAPTFELGGAAGLYSTVISITGVAVGTTQMTVEGPEEVSVFPNPVQVTVGSAVSTIPSYFVGRNLQGSTTIDLGPGFVNPGGTIVTLTSSDPEKLRLSRSAAAPGTASVTVAVAAGERRTQSVYLQGIGEGEAAVTVVLNGATRTAATVAIVPSWLSCGTPSLTLPANESRTLQCSLRTTALAASTALSSVEPRAGLGNLTVRASSSDTAVFKVSSQDIPITGSWADILLQPVGHGTAQLRVTQPAGFGPPADGSDTVAVTVALSVVPILISDIKLGKDTQRVFPIHLVPSGVTVTATSEQPSLLIISTDPQKAGSASARGAGTASSELQFVLQALASAGTAEVVFSAPGYAPLRVPVVLRPTDFAITNLSSPNTLTLRTGATATLQIGLRVRDSWEISQRAGATITGEITASPSGIVAVEPVRFTMPPATGSSGRPAEVQIRGVAPGSALIRITATEDFGMAGSPVVVTVNP